ncbi:taste receptor type 2 member 40-like [Ranitomeya variabilis]|uniref:taste receptor type 2 member 40-like n=1 Tax=Ranitomeya variabilis TaxID=490064 RepID=UPI0040571640
MTAGVFGLVLNSWIVHVNAKGWRRGFHPSLPDKILTFMGLINIALQVVLCFDMTSIQTKSYSSFDQIHLSCIGLFIFLISSNVWLTAWLSIYYCMRIVNFTRGIFLICKMRISRLLPKLLVVSTAASFILCLLSFWNIYDVINVEVIGNSTYNHTREQRSIAVSSPYEQTVFVGCILPLIVTLIPIGMTVSSLWRHMKRMHSNKANSCHFRTEVHVRAVRTMVLLVSLHTTLLVAAIYTISQTFNFLEFLMFFCWYFIIFYPTAQALVIITGNSKLREASRGVLCSRMITR